MSAVVRVHPEELRAEPGAVVEVDVLITNVSPVVEVYRFEALGMPGGAFFDPAEMSLLPDEDGRAVGHLTVSIDAPLGEVRPAVRAVGETSGSVSATDFGLLVGERPDIEAALRPPTSHGYRTGKHSLSLTNNGTLPTSVEVFGAGDNDAVDVRVPATANIDTGETREVPVVVKTRRRPERGERFGFTVTVNHSGQTTVLPGLLQCEGRPVKAWLIGGAAGLLVLLLIAFLLVRSDGGGSDLAASEGPSSTRLFLDTGVTTLPPVSEATTIPTTATTTIITFPTPVLSAPPIIPPATPPPTVATTQAPTSTTRAPNQQALADRVYKAWQANDNAQLKNLVVPELLTRLQQHTDKGTGQGPGAYAACDANVPPDYTPDDAGNCVRVNFGGCTEQEAGFGIAYIEVVGDGPSSFLAADFAPCD